MYPYPVSSSELALLEFCFSHKPIPLLSNLSQPFLVYWTNKYAQLTLEQYRGQGRRSPMHLKIHIQLLAS